MFKFVLQNGIATKQYFGLLVANNWRLFDPITTLLSKRKMNEFKLSLY